MTGRYVHNHGVKHFVPYELDQETTIQHYLSDSGYRTAFFGKYLNKWRVEDDPPHFDAWATFPQSSIKTYSGGRWNVNGEVQNINVYSTQFLLRQAMRFLDRSDASNDSLPWLMFVSVPAAHEPFVVEDRYRGTPVGTWDGNPAVFDNLDDKPAYLSARESRACDLECGRSIRAGQYRTLYSVDDLIPKIFDHLDGLKENENTLAFFISDNGSNWGEYGLSGKRYPYTPSVKVPMLMRWPLVLDAGVDARLVANIDVAPTILDAADLTGQIATPMDGRSLLQEFNRSRLLLEHWGTREVPSWASIRTADFQYIEYYKDQQHSHRFENEYYDLRVDRWQRNNLLAGNDPRSGPSEERLKQLQRILAGALKCAGSACP